MRGCRGSRCAPPGVCSNAVPSSSACTALMVHSGRRPSALPTGTCRSGGMCFGTNKHSMIRCGGLRKLRAHTARWRTPLRGCAARRDAMDASATGCTPTRLLAEDVGTLVLRIQTTFRARLPVVRGHTPRLSQINKESYAQRHGYDVFIYEKALPSARGPPPGASLGGLSGGLGSGPCPQ